MKGFGLGFLLLGTSVKNQKRNRPVYSHLSEDICLYLQHCLFFYFGSDSGTDNKECRMAHVTNGFIEDYVKLHSLRDTCVLSFVSKPS